MKKEVRILYIACKGYCCCGIVLRGSKLIDWAFCTRADRVDDVFCSSGVAGETRYYNVCEGRVRLTCAEPIPHRDGCNIAQSILETLLQLTRDCRTAVVWV